MLPVTAAIASRAADIHLSKEDLSRYSRHILLPELGPTGQAKLKAARVLLVGAGGLGSPVATYLTAAGIGTLGIVEFDVVEASNLQRQILYTEADLGTSKLNAATRRLNAQSATTTIVPFAVALDQSNARHIIQDFDIVVDGSDNFWTRYLVNEICTELSIPNIYGSIFRFEGQASVFYAPHGPCYRCLFPAPPADGAAPNCAEGGVLGVLPGQIGMIQATETIKLILGLGQPLLGRLVMYDALRMSFDEFSLERDPNCPSCSGKASDMSTLLSAIDACRRPTSAAEHELISVDALAEMLKAATPHTLLDVRSADEVSQSSIPGHIHIPLDALTARTKELDRNTPLIVYCQSGQRSRTAAELLRRQGFQRVLSLVGGILAWKEGRSSRPSDDG